jgi:hypothetical protein
MTERYHEYKFEVRIGEMILEDQTEDTVRAQIHAALEDQLEVWQDCTIVNIY